MLADERVRDLELGIGNAVNRYLIEEMARRGRGLHELVMAAADVEEAVLRFQDPCEEQACRASGIALRAIWTILVHMRRTSLVEAKAHLSELVERAERRAELTLICRHGRPAAAIVPVSVATAAAGGTAAPPLAPEDAIALLDRMAAREQPATSLDEALGRNRLDPIRG